MPEYPYIPPANTPVWVANGDGTTDKRWVDIYDPSTDRLYLRTVQSAKTWNNVLREYPAAELGRTIFYSYLEAGKAARRMARERLAKIRATSGGVSP